MNKKLVILSVLFLVIVGLVAYFANVRAVKIAETIPAPTPVVDAKNATYNIEGTKITLHDGVFSEPAAPNSATQIVTRYFGNEALGDFNGDGKQDTAFLLTQDGGGSGSFFYIAVALGEASGVQGTNALFLGDRIAPQNVEWMNGKIIANYAVRKAGEPMTAQPSIGVSMYFTVVNNTLVAATATSTHL